jgi:hypothetical protein
MHSVTTLQACSVGAAVDQVMGVSRRAAGDRSVGKEQIVLLPLPPQGRVRYPSLSSSQGPLSNHCHHKGGYGARFRQNFTLEDAIGSHACSLQASMCVNNGIHLGVSTASYRYHRKLCRNAEGTLRGSGRSSKAGARPPSCGTSSEASTLAQSQSRGCEWEAGQNPPHTHAHAHRTHTHAPTLSLTGFLFQSLPFSYILFQFLQFSYILLHSLTFSPIFHLPYYVLFLFGIVGLEF